MVNPDEDRVELAFRRIDLNNDGFITWDEFVQVLIHRVEKNSGLYVELFRMLET